MDNAIKKVVIYARVSSDRQDVDLSITSQLKALRDYAARNNYFVIIKGRHSKTLFNQF